MDNPQGREQILKGMDKHNKFIVSSAPYITCHQDPSVIEFKTLRGQRPNWMPTPYEAQLARSSSDTMHRLIKDARSCVDSSPPSLPWHHHKLCNLNRRLKLQDPEYWRTKGHEIQWSVTEAQEATTAFKAMTKAKRCKRGCSIDNKLSSMTLQYLEWKRQEAETKLPPIDVPVQPQCHKGRNLSPAPEPLAVGSPLDRKDLTWASAEGPQGSRQISFGVPDHCPDALKLAVSQGAPKDAGMKGQLPEALVKRTIQNGWMCASNQLVKDRFLARQLGKDPSEGALRAKVDISEVIGELSPLARPSSQQLMYKAKVQP